MHEHLWVEQIGGLIVVRVRAQPTEELLRQCQQQVLKLVHATGCSSVLYDTLEMQAPPLDIPWFQRHLDETLGTALRRAIVVPDTRLAYLARLAFGDGDYRVFYRDVSAAAKWLSDSAAAPA